MTYDFVGAVSASSLAYLLGILLVLVATAAPRPRRRALRWTGAAIVGVTMVARLVAVHPQGDTRWVDRVLDERDMAVLGARAVRATGTMHDGDLPRLPGAMADAYEEMARTQGQLLASPFAATYLGLQRPGASDTLVFPAEGDTALVFLHGFAGNFTLSCWLVARAAGMTTVCPSTRWRGDWWSADGEHIVRDALQSLRQAGKTHLVLGGLSNGGVGASRLAPKLTGLEGLLVVSGADADAEPPGVPVLVVHGTRDRQIPVEVGRAYAERTRGEMVELAAGHFALLLERERAGDAIARWLAKTTAGRR